ncbi:MAG: PQQ-dependent sugar dehydrogenase, partial [Nitrospira sp.]|nr:PQQ-dependent sugar dehydrogenase [Nitrospira sp.]
LDAQGSRRSEPFLDLRSKIQKLNQGFDERGILGLALHPKFTENRKLYAYYSAPLRASCPTNWDHTSRICEFTTTPDFNRVDPASERILLEIDQPYFNHNGGRMVFGPDGFLYIAMGDGGNANDEGHDRAPTGNGQDLTTLLGKILRIDVDRAEGSRRYGIPQDNPFVGKPGARPEIYAWGIRNPWGISFDRGGRHELFAADVGQARYEEINLITKGGNYGWNQREGRHAFVPKNPNKVGAEPAMQPADREAFLDPILEYKNLNAFPQDPAAQGISVTGGFVYSGRALPHLQGHYIFADWSRQWAVPDGRLFAATPPKDGGRSGWSMQPLPVASNPDHKLGAYVVGFGEDAEGELYVLTTQRALENPLGVLCRRERWRRGLPVELPSPPSSRPLCPLGRPAASRRVRGRPQGRGH